jgi:hypothetical protein
MSTMARIAFGLFMFALFAFLPAIAYTLGGGQ